MRSVTCLLFLKYNTFLKFILTHDIYRAVIQQEAKRSALIVPNAANMSVMDQSQSTEMSDYTAKSADFPVKGSFLNRKKDLHAEVESPKPSTRNVEITAKSSKKPVTKARVAAAPRVREQKIMCLCSESTL